MLLSTHAILQILRSSVAEEPRKKDNKLLFTRVRFVLVLGIFAACAGASGMTGIIYKITQDTRPQLVLDIPLLLLFAGILGGSLYGLLNYRNCRLEYLPQGQFNYYNTWGARRHFSFNEIVSTRTDFNGNLLLRLSNGKSIKIDGYFNGFQYLKELLI